MRSEEAIKEKLAELAVSNSDPFDWGMMAALDWVLNDAEEEDYE